MSYFVIPLTSDPDQSFKCTIPIDGNNVSLSIRIRYNHAGNYWSMTVSDPKTGVVILSSIPLLTGKYPAADILEQYRYLGLGTACVIKIGNALADYPGSKNLGTDFVLVWGDTVV